MKMTSNQRQASTPKGTNCAHFLTVIHNTIRKSPQIYDTYDGKTHLNCTL